jgi:hypothetical protein
MGPPPPGLTVRCPTAPPARGTSAAHRAHPRPHERGAPHGGKGGERLSLTRSSAGAPAAQRKIQLSIRHEYSCLVDARRERQIFWIGQLSQRPAAKNRAGRGAKASGESCPRRKVKLALNDIKRQMYLSGNRIHEPDTYQKLSLRPAALKTAVSTNRGAGLVDLPR